MNYFPPFEVIRRSVDIQAVRGDLRVNMSYEDFVELLKLMIRGIEVDEEWYVRAYDDIGQAIRAETIRSARHHFVNDGYFEGRLPAPIRVVPVVARSMVTQAPSSTSSSTTTLPTWGSLR